MSIEIREDQYLEIENLHIGTFAPVKSFMNEAEYWSCLEKMRLPTGGPFTIPIVFDISAEDYNRYKLENEIELTYLKEKVAVLRPQSFFRPDKEKSAKFIYGVTDLKHPGVKDFLALNPYFVSGEIRLLKRPSWPFSQFQKDPWETKEIFKQKGWRTVIGFQTRNAPHRAHEYLQKAALEIADGIFIQPLVGKKKPGDFTPEAVILGYKALIDNYFPQDRIHFGILSTKMRYAGPREAILHSIIRRNYGCTHFIVGRDHAGVGSYYGKYEAHDLFDQFEGELGISILKMHGPYYCYRCDNIVTEKTCPHGNQQEFVKHISGSDFRESLKNNKTIDTRIVRPEVIEVLKGIEVFIQ